MGIKAKDSINVMKVIEEAERPLTVEEVSKKTSIDKDLVRRILNELVELSEIASEEGYYRI